MPTRTKIVQEVVICFLFLLVAATAFGHNLSREGGGTPERASGSYFLDLDREKGQGTIGGLIMTSKTMVTRFKERMTTIWSGLAYLPTHTLEALNRLSHNRGTGFVGMQFLMFAAIVCLAFLGESGFYRFVKNLESRNKGTLPSCIGTLFKKIFFRMLIDIAGLFTFALLILLVFIFFIPSQGLLYDLIITYVPAITVIRLTFLLLKFVYSPKEPHMRIAPENCMTAALYFIGILAFVGATLVLKQTIFLLKANGLQRDTFFLYYSGMGFFQFFLLMIILWKDRIRITRLIVKRKSDIDSPPGSDTGKINLLWIGFGISVLISFEFLWQLNLVVFEKDLTIPLLLTILSLPFGYLLFSIAQRLLLIASGKTDLMDPRVINKDILKPGMDVLKMLNIELPEAPEAADISTSKTSVIESYLPVMEKIMITLISLLLFFWIFELWGISIPIGIQVTRSALTIFITLLISYIAWELCRTYIDWKIRMENPDAEEDEDPEGGAGGSRKATILSLVKRFILSGLMIIVILTILNSMGINIAPLMAGAGILGIAIGFGSQALVKDILSGLFFLIDDAFRVGDFIETSGIKGSVQQISLRSIKVRHPRGMLFTIPYGDMGSIKNFSRDYIITKLDLRVKYDANIDKIRKIIKKINKGMQKDEEYNTVLLSKIKSQGVRQMDDSAMVLRVKYKTIPGGQFTVRKELFKQIQEAFKENGIEFAHKNVTVYLPPETDATEDQKQKLISAGSAAAAAAIGPEALPEPSKG